MLLMVTKFLDACIGIGTWSQLPSRMIVTTTFHNKAETDN